MSSTDLAAKPTLFGLDVRALAVAVLALPSRSFPRETLEAVADTLRWVAGDSIGGAGPLSLAIGNVCRDEQAKIDEAARKLYALRAGEQKVEVFTANDAAVADFVAIREAVKELYRKVDFAVAERGGAPEAADAAPKVCPKCGQCFTCGRPYPEGWARGADFKAPALVMHFGCDGASA